MKKAVLFEKLSGSKVKCTACQNYCVIPEGKTGICAVRKNIGGDLYLLVYGQAAAANIDPIEKKPLYHFFPGEKVFTIGTVGCNFGCEFCQNYDISQSIKEARLMKKDIQSEFLSYGNELSPQQIINFCEENRIRMVAFSYNEPAIFFEYAFDTMKLAKKKGIKTVFVSNGYESVEALEKMKGYLDAINIDLKSFSDDFYRRICHSRLKPVLDTIKRCYDLGIWVELTTLFIPGENDSEEEVKQIIDFIASIDQNIPWHISAFYPTYKMRNKKATPHEKLIIAYKLGKKRLNHVYVGNVYDPERSATYCPKCKRVLIERQFYTTNVVGIKNSRCVYCNEKIAGVFK